MFGIGCGSCSGFPRMPAGINSQNLSVAPTWFRVAAFHSHFGPVADRSSLSRLTPLKHNKQTTYIRL